jgi:hypothetical protein
MACCRISCVITSRDPLAKQLFGRVFVICQVHCDPLYVPSSNGTNQQVRHGKADQSNNRSLSPSITFAPDGAIIINYCPTQIGSIHATVSVDLCGKNKIALDESESN